MKTFAKLLILFVMVWGFMYVTSWQFACEDNGGVYVKTSAGFKCIRAVHP